MNKIEINKLKDIIREEGKKYDFNDYIFNYIDEEDLKDLEFDDLEDYFVNLNKDMEITDVEIIYYSNAMNYLKEYDISLKYSLELAGNLGFNLKNLSSEVLASILKSDNNLNDYNDFIGEIIKKMEE